MSDLSMSVAEPKQVDFARWRRRSRFIRRLRIILPVVIAAILLALGGAVTYSSLAGGPRRPQESDGPIKLTNPRFIGRDDKGRPFVITADNAVRDPQDYQRVMLDKPVLVMDESGPDPTRITGAKGVYMEATQMLHLSGGVRVAGARGAFDTADSVYDTKTGELAGSGPIQGLGPLGQVNSKSYGVYGKGDRMVFSGGVHTRIEGKK